MASEHVSESTTDDALVASVLKDADGATVVEQQYASSQTRYHRVAVPVDGYVAAVSAAKDAGFDMFVDLYAVDHFAQAPRFEVGVNLVSMSANHRIIISTRVPYDDPTVPTVTGLFIGANFYEREAYDLFGIDFPGHPDLTRILLPDEWDGYPLRKDASVGAIPVQFKEGSVDL
ncbi:MAG: NADH-quinone oxidoreductase subunit C [Armatimonadetes bacterium]|nr:MAG: NADH-quinone oxidoreductase subunit C [Armatimonadota bacterium]